jgi:leader peptidase (prepilin peptidase) / N-methyltransferase
MMALMEAVLAAFSVVWLFAFGAAWGSFLNVVAYRLPLGKNLVWPPSACPRCDTPIRGTDNIPVLGWLRLRGRCRACQLPIAMRYPVVEALAGVIFLAFALVELGTDGSNLPGRFPQRERGFLHTLWSIRPDLARIFAAHSVLLFAWIALALIGWDGARVAARKFWLWLGLPLLAAAACWPELLPVAFGTPRVAPRWAAPATAFCGAALGGLAGWWLFRRNPAALATTLAGTFLGPAAVLPIAVAARAAPERLAAAGVGAVGLAYLAFWRHWHATAWLPNPSHGSPVWAAWLGGALVLGWICHRPDEKIQCNPPAPGAGGP